MKLLRRTALSVLLVSLLIAATTFATKVYRHVNPPPIKSRATIVRPEKIAPPTLPKTAAEASARGKSAFGKLPLTFELNQGQADKQVKFLSPGKGYNLFLTGTEAALSLRKGDGAMRRNGAKKLSAHSALRTPSSALVKLQLINANPNAEVTGLDELPGKSNYFLGNDPTQWRTNVANYRQVKYAAVYPGIDQIYYGNQQQLEYDFVVAPQADPGVIKLSFDGATKMRLNKQGDLELFTPAGKVVQHRPNIYQTINGVKLTIAGHYVLQNKNQVGFVVGAYNKSQPLIIDPQLSYATFLGGSGQDNPLSIAVDPAGNAYITGITYATDFPTTPGAIKTSAYRDRQLAFVTKLNADGTALAYSTYLGSSADNSCAPDSWGQAITVDAEGNAYLGGQTNGSNFPTLPPNNTIVCYAWNGFVTKLSPVGGLLYSAYLANTDVTGIGVDQDGKIHVTGAVGDAFVTTANAYQQTGGNVFVAKIDPTLPPSTTSPIGITTPVYASRISGVFPNPKLVVDASGNTIITGSTDSANPNFHPTLGAFQTTFGGGVRDGVVMKFDLRQAGSASLLYATYLGGNDDDFSLGVAVSASGEIFVTGSTKSPNFPVTPPFNPLEGNTYYAAFLVKLDPQQAGANALQYALHHRIGERDYYGVDVGVDSQGQAYNLVVDGTGQTGVHSYKADGSGVFDIPHYIDSAYGKAIAVQPEGIFYVTGLAGPAFIASANTAQPNYKGNGDGFVYKLDRTDLQQPPPDTLASDIDSPESLSNRLVAVKEKS